MSIANPFYIVGPIDDVKMFFDRQSLIETLLNSLFADRPQCLSIIGQRKIGKTSLVEHMFKPSVLEQFGRDGSRYCPIYFNCQTHAASLSSREKFFRALVQEINKQTPPHIAESLNIKVDETESYSDWNILLHAFDRQDYNLILILDEFDKAVIQETLINEGVFGVLRGFASDVARFKWITCSNQYLHVLFTEAFDEFHIPKIKRVSESDFYNISPTNVVGLFNQADALSLINEPMQRINEKFSQQEIETIIQCGGTFPYFVQRACFHTLNAHWSGSIRKDEIIRLFLQDTQPIWDSYWRRLDSSHHEALIEIAHNRQPSISERNVNYLKEMSLIKSNANGSLYPFSDEFGRYILMHEDSVPSARSKKYSVAKNNHTNQDNDKVSNHVSVDVLLVAVTSTEVKAIFECFGGYKKKRVIAGKVYYDLGKIQGARVFLVQSDTMGTATIGGSLLTINKAIENLSPSAVIMVGIAFGVNSEKQAIGDILVSEKLMAYEPQRIIPAKGTKIKIIERGSRIDASTRLLDKFRSGELDWPVENVKFGLLLSGEKLIDNIEFRNSLLSIEPEAIGGEMEGAGLYVAAHQQKVDWIVVKAICDWADGHKDENKQARQKNAAQNAARFTYHVLKQGGWLE